MKKVVIEVFGETYADLAAGAEHATIQLRMKTPSELWEADKLRILYDVTQDANLEWKEIQAEQ